MLKPIREVSEEERNKRALLVIHGLTFMYDFPLISDDFLREKAEKLDRLLYYITHAVTGCSAKNCPAVEAGFRHIEELEDSLNQANIIDVEFEITKEQNESNITSNPVF